MFNIAGVSHKTEVEKSHKPKRPDSLECTAGRPKLGLPQFTSDRSISGKNPRRLLTWLFGSIPGILEKKLNDITSLLSTYRYMP
jgi:hypothetical protein